MQIAGFSGSGKTEVCLRLAVEAQAVGPVAYVKSHHGNLERPDSNTGRMGAFAALRLLAGRDGTMRLGRAQNLTELLDEARAAACAVALVEGFKGSAGAKTWLRRDVEDAPPRGVFDVRLDLLGEAALAMPPAELWAMVPRREY